MATEDAPLDPEDAFWLLGDETRIAILRAVWAAPETPLSFTEIRDRVGRPDSGQFNYHIDKLRGHFLAQTDGGYELTQAGREVVRAVLAGTLTERPATAAAPIDAECTECGGELVARYDEYGHIECDDCGSTVMWNEFPPAGLEGRDPAEIARAFDRWTQRRFRLAMDGVCPSCAAAMEVTRIEGEPEADAGIASLHQCANCRYEARVPLFGHVLDHPEVIAFFYDRGVDITALPYWRLQSLARDFSTSVVSTDPWRAAITVEDSDAALRLTLDDGFDVDEIELAGA